MTEAEWWASSDPEAMLALVLPRHTERKLRLFGCACSRRVFPEMEHDGSQALVELTERYADGLATLAELETTYQLHDRYCSGATPEWKYINPADQAALSTAFPYGASLAQHVAHWAARGKVRVLLRPVGEEVEVSLQSLVLPGGELHPGNETWLQYQRELEARVKTLHRAEAELTAHEQRVQTDYLRDVFGNPFRPAALDPSWLTAAVVGLARGVYDDRTFDRLPVLGDALEDAGCTDADILAHCRRDGPHVRGCWAVDLLLGKA